MEYTYTTQTIIDTNYKLTYEPLSTYTAIDNFTNGNNLFILSATKHSIVSGPVPEDNNNLFETIIDNDTLQQIVNTPYNIHNILQQSDTKIKLVKKDFLPFITQIGTNGYLERITNTKYDKTPINDFIKCANSPDYEFIEYVGSQNCDAWKNSKGDLFCPPIKLDYIDAQLHNKKYNLDDLIEHLLPRDDIAFIIQNPKPTLLRCPLIHDNKQIQHIIEDIPYYNAEDGKDESISVIYYPKMQEIQKLIDWKYDNKFYSLALFIMNDIINTSTQYLKEPISPESYEQPKRRFKS
jgi:hypothetical protein